MASPGNPNQVVGGSPFDMTKFFNPSPTPNPILQNPNNTTNIPSPYPPPPPASYPPPTGPYSYSPQPPQFNNNNNNHLQQSLLLLLSLTCTTRDLPLILHHHFNPLLFRTLMLGPNSWLYWVPHRQILKNRNNPRCLWFQSTFLVRGRHLVGDHVVYDIDSRLEGELQPQLEVTPITKYVSDPGLLLGHQIAVNKTYICYGLKMGNVRVLNINTALRSLLKGLAQRVTDMAFFAEDVHLLASASENGRVYVWKITEGPDEEDKPQITGKLVIAIQIVGEGKSVHPRVCWHCHKQEVLVVGIGRCVLRIDTTKVGKGEVCSAEDPLICDVGNLIDGVQHVGKHEGEFLSVCILNISFSTDKNLGGPQTAPLVVLRPHDGQPVNSVTFLTAPHRPDHIVLITGGPMNREVKIWTLASEEGWLLPSDAEAWHCTQTLDLKSSAESRIEESFFNQVVALSQAGLLLLANAKKNAIYAGEQNVQVYCVQTQAIQQYALDLSQCLPPPLENMVLEKSDAIVLREATSTEGFPTLEPSVSKLTVIPLSSSAPKLSVHDSGYENAPMMRHIPSCGSMDATTSVDFVTSSLESSPIALPTVASNIDISCVASPPLPLSPRLSKNLSGLRSPKTGFEPGPVVDDRGGDQHIVEYSVDRHLDTVLSNLSDVPSLDDDTKNDENKLVRDDVSAIINQPIKFKHPTHLVTPSEILMATSSSETDYVTVLKSEGEVNIQDVVAHSDMPNVEVDVKVVGETGFNQNNQTGSQGEPPNPVPGNKDRAFYSQASDRGIEMAKECSALSFDTYNAEECRQLAVATVAQPSNAEEDILESGKDITAKDVGSAIPAPVPQQVAPTTKGKSRRVRALKDRVHRHHLLVLSIQRILPLKTMQKEAQKQVTMMVSDSVSKEGRRLETSLGKNMEKAVKANCDALWARFQEEKAKEEKSVRERTQQITGLITNCINKDLPALVEKTVKKELSGVGPNIARTIPPVIEKTASSAIAEAFQRGVGDKAVNQLEKSVNSKLEAAVARQIQAQFQTSGKQALQDSLKNSLEASVIPAFEMSCKAMFEQVDATFQKGMVEHTTAAQQQFDSTLSPLALALRDTITSASSLTQTLSGELADGQRKLLVLAATSKIEAPWDPTTELSRLISEHKYEEAFNVALQRSDVSIVSWLCSQVDLPRILLMTPLPLSQGVLLSLLQQIACDISKDTSRKLTWMRDVAVAINPADPMIAMHVRPIFEQVYQIVNHHRSLPTSSSADLSNIRLVLHVLNSMLMTCK
ncbi:hypothetical protein C3L33_11488, partial [Rhododendron williamsianum]